MATPSMRNACLSWIKPDDRRASIVLTPWEGHLLFTCLIDARQRAKLKTLADRLTRMQELENEGRGVSCVRSICTYLERGELGLAQNVATIDWDKIRNYPNLATTINIRLFAAYGLAELH